MRRDDWIPAYARTTNSNGARKTSVAVIPAKAGIQSRHQHDEPNLCFVSGSNWIPAYAGMTDPNVHVVVP